MRGASRIRETVELVLATVGSVELSLEIRERPSFNSVDDENAASRSRALKMLSGLSAPPSLTPFMQV